MLNTVKEIYTFIISIANFYMYSKAFKNIVIYVAHRALNVL